MGDFAVYLAPVFILNCQLEVDSCLLFQFLLCNNGFNVFADILFGGLVQFCHVRLRQSKLSAKFLQGKLGSAVVGGV